MGRGRAAERREPGTTAARPARGDDGLSVNPAVRAEPRGIGTSRARDPLAREVKLLGALLGQVIVEQEGVAALQLVEKVRRATIDLRRTGSRVHRRALASLLDSVDLPQAELLIRAFSLYFQLTNLAEEKQRVRRLRRQGRSAPRGVIADSVAAAVEHMRRERLPWSRVAELLQGLSVGLVLTAHPTEARRRTLLVALRRVYRLLDGLDDPRLTPTEDAEIRRGLREEITLLWHTSALRLEPPTPLDEVRSAMVFFDESLFVVTPQLYRALDGALDRAADGSPGGGVASRDAGRTGTRPPYVPAYLRWGSWVGGDRDGNPNVTAETTRQAVRVQADHVLRAYEAVSTRLMTTITASVSPATVDARLAERLAGDAAELTATARVLERRFPGEPYRQRFGYIAERLRRTRARVVDEDAGTSGGYASPTELLAELDELRDALIADRLGRVAHGELQDLRWQVETFGFHALSMEVRQHAEVHSATLAALRARPEDAAREVSAGVSAGEVLETLRVVARIQETYGREACHRYVVSFTRSARDVLDVLELASTAGLSTLDVVPLFESADALEGCERILDDLLGDPGYRRHLRERGDHQEVMLGYSDSTKESGSLAAGWMLYRAQERLAQGARRHDVRLTLFHGRGGAIGRGGGPMNRAILASAPGSIQGRLKLTEQGEVIADRYANVDICLRHLEQLTNAVLIGSTSEHDERARDAGEAGAPIIEELAETSRGVYRTLVWEDPAFEGYFRGATPIGELAGLAIGSRPAARASGRTGEAPSLSALRAIPWVFAWSQSRTNLPGWYGIGSALAGYQRDHGEDGLRRLRRLYAEWPFFASVLDNAEMSLAKADLQVAQRYASLAPPYGARRIWRRIKTEAARTEAAVLHVTGRERLLDAMPVLQRSIALRNPYVDSLSELQVRLLARLRALPIDDPHRQTLLRLVHLTVNGVAAGVQNTG